MGLPQLASIQQSGRGQLKEEPLKENHWTWHSHSGKSPEKLLSFPRLEEKGRINFDEEKKRKEKKRKEKKRKEKKRKEKKRKKKKQTKHRGPNSRTQKG